MNSLSAILNESTAVFLKRLRIVIAFAFMAFIIVSILKIESRKNEINGYVTNLFVNNIEVASEEEKMIEVISNFNNSFDISLAQKELSDFCGPINCYQISFFKLYESNLILTVLFLILLLSVHFIVRLNESRKRELLEDQFTYLNNALLGKEIKNSSSISKEIQKIVHLVDSREESLRYLYNTKTIAHDIKSPLMVLELVASDLEDLPEESKELVLMAINRINQIANDLSQKKVQVDNYCSPSKVIQNIIREKMIEYKDKKEVQFNFIDNSVGIEKISVDSISFGRTVSNLINNSVEAMSNLGTISVRLEISHGKAIINIDDNGEGFPSEILNNPITQGQTIGKVHGQGLGLFHSYKTITENNGLFRILNLSDGGARVNLSLPLIS